MNEDTETVQSAILPANADICLEPPEDAEADQWIALSDGVWLRLGQKLPLRILVPGDAETEAEVYFNTKSLSFRTRRAGSNRSKVLNSAESLDLQADLLEQIHQALLTAQPRLFAGPAPNQGGFPTLDWPPRASAPRRLEILTKHRRTLAHQPKPQGRARHQTTGALLISELSNLPHVAAARVELHHSIANEVTYIRWVQSGDMDVPWGALVPHLSDGRLTLKPHPNEKAAARRRFGALLMLLGIARAYNHIYLRPRWDIQIVLEICGQSETTRASLSLGPDAWGLSLPACCLDPDPDHMPDGMTLGFAREPNKSD